MLMNPNGLDQSQFNDKNGICIGSFVIHPVSSILRIDCAHRHHAESPFAVKLRMAIIS